MTGNLTTSLHIVGLSEKGVKVVTPSSTGWEFWLPRGSQVRWAEPPEVGSLVGAVIPSWLASKHKQLGEEAFVEAKRNHQRPTEPSIERKEPMADQREMSGAIFKNLEKQKPSHPDYRGDITIRGEKFRLSGWIKEGSKGKFLSLAATPAEEKNGTVARKPAPADDDEIPF